MTRTTCRLRVVIHFTILLVCSGLSWPAEAQELDDSCVVSILNRTAASQPDGSYILPNTPSNMGQVRARATCVKDGVTRSGQSDYFTFDATSRAVPVPPIVFGVSDPVPETLQISAPFPTLNAVGATLQLTVSATFSDLPRDVTPATEGTNYTSSNPAVASVSADGLVTAQASGVVLVTAINEGTLAVARLQVIAGADSDADGLPDDWEIARGLDPNDPTDALIDFDQDGLSTLEEFQGGLDPFDPDTDADGLLDGEEGAFGTDPLLFDTDGDGLSDGLEVQLGTDPLDPNDFDLGAALTSIAITPPSFQLIFNTLLGETSTQLTVTGQLIDGATIDLTARGTSYASSDLTVCNFGLDPGRIFAGLDGGCTITASNSGHSAQAAGTVQGFAPVPVGTVALPGTAHNVDVAGDLAYVAAGAAGLQVVDISDRAAPVIVASVDTPGDARDVKVVGAVAYVADGGAGLRVVDVSDPLAPALLGVAATPGGALDVAPAGSFVYVAAGAGGFHAVDVRDPAAPVVLASVTTPGSAGGVALDAANARLLVADGAAGLSIYDVSVVSSPQRLGGVATGDARDVVARGTAAFVADGMNGFVAVDVSDPATPVLGAPVPRETGGLLNDVAISGNFAFGADFFFVNGVPILDVSNPQAPIPRAILDFSAAGGANGTGLAVDNLYVYRTSGSRLDVGQYLLAEDTAGVPPAVTIRSPEDGDSLESGTVVDFRVDAEDDVAVAVVRFLVDGAQVFADTTAPYELALALPPETADLTLGAVAEDLAGSSTAASEIVVHVLPDVEPPVIEASTPAPDTNFASGDTVTATAVVTDDQGVARVAFRFDGRSVTDTVAPYSADFLTPLVTAATPLEVEIEAFDLGENPAAVTIPVTALPLADAAPPAVTITTPGNGAAVLAGAQIDIHYSVRDEHSIESYSLAAGGGLLDSADLVGATAIDRQVTFTAPASAQPGDSFTVHAEARDFGGNVTIDEITLVVPTGTILSGDQTLDASYDGQSLILGAGTYTVVEPLALENLTVLAGATVTGEVEETLSITVAGTLNVSLGGGIDVSARGFAGGTSSHPDGYAPSFVAGSATDAGGSHGGAGVVWDAPGPAGEVYGSVYAPRLGGGGGSRDETGFDGTRGGGVVELEAGSLVLDGTVRALGAPSAFNSSRPAGAGGSVRIQASSMSGSGSIDASGASTSTNNSFNNRPGAGGGGRVAVVAQDLQRFDAARQVRARGGRRYRSDFELGYAAPGTVLVADAASPLGRLIVDNGAGRIGPVTELPALGAGAVTGFAVAGADAWVSTDFVFLPRWRGAWMALADGTGIDLGVFRVLEIDPAGRALLEGAGSVTGAATLIGEYRFDAVELLNGSGLAAGDRLIATEVTTTGAARLPARLEAVNVTVESGSVATVSSGGTLELTATGTLTIEAGARIDLSGRGYAGGDASHPEGYAPPFVTGSATDAGGSHGGRGVVWNAPGPPGEVYGSVFVPLSAGGGGSRDEDGQGGTAGGGVIQLEVGELVLDGEIRSNGAPSAFNSSRPAGAGGSVLIKASSMSGGGSINASGAATATNSSLTDRPGAGGGGRVALYVEDSQGFDPVAGIRARGGRRFRSTLEFGYAAPGTVYVASAASLGRLIVDNGAGRAGPATELPALGGGGVTDLVPVGADARVSTDVPLLPRWLGAWMALTDTLGADLGSFRVLEIDPAGRALIEGAGTVVGAAGFYGEYRFGAVDELSGSGIVAGDPVIVGSP